MKYYTHEKILAVAFVMKYILTVGPEKQSFFKATNNQSNKKKKSRVIRLLKMKSPSKIYIPNSVLEQERYALALFPPGFVCMKHWACFVVEVSKIIRKAPEATDKMRVTCQG